MDRIQLIFADSASYLQQLDQEEKTVDVVYLDPMFPQRDQNQQAIKNKPKSKADAAFAFTFTRRWRNGFG